MCDQDSFSLLTIFCSDTEQSLRDIAAFVSLMKLDALVMLHELIFSSVRIFMKEIRRIDMDHHALVTGTAALVAPPIMMESIKDILTKVSIILKIVHIKLAAFKAQLNCIQDNVRFIFCSTVLFIQS